jgi:Nucleoside transporter
MVARFANKNTIALGLGCSASGPLILLLQITLGLESIPTFEQQVALFLIIAVVVASGLWATVSLLFRHWDAIEASAHGGGVSAADMQQQQQLASPLLGDAETGSGGVLEREDFSFATPVGVEGGSPRTAATTPRSPLYKTPSLPPLIAYNLLEPYETFLSAREDWTPSPLLRRTSSREREESPTAAAALSGGAYHNMESALPSLAGAAHSENDLLRLGLPSNNNTETELEEEKEEELSSAHTLAATISDVWPALIVVGLQGGIALTLFPFFTYLPSSGWIGVESLPKLLFFVRIFSDILGRILPRSTLFKPSTIRPVITVAFIKLATEPLFFIYLKANAKWHSDLAAVVYIALMWAAGGYVNTTAYMIAPQMVRPELKSTAAGLMAMTYQLGHFIGLATAAVLARVM